MTGAMLPVEAVRACAALYLPDEPQWWGDSPLPWMIRNLAQSVEVGCIRAQDLRSLHATDLSAWEMVVGLRRRQRFVPDPGFVSRSTTSAGGAWVDYYEYTGGANDG